MSNTYLSTPLGEVMNYLLTCKDLRCNFLNCSLKVTKGEALTSDLNCKDEYVLNADSTRGLILNYLWCVCVWGWCVSVTEREESSLIRMHALRPQILCKERKCLWAKNSNSE